MPSDHSEPLDNPARENTLDRRLTLLTTLLTIMAGLVGGVVGAGGAYLGVREQIQGQNQVVTRQIDNSRVSYFRDQRRIAYAKFLQEATANWVAMQKGMGSIYRSHGTPGAARALDAISPTMTQFGFALADVRLIGDAHVADKANAVQLAFVRFDVWLIEHRGSRPLTPAFLDGGWRRLRQIGKLTDDYVAAVRSDIGSDGL